MIYYFTPRFILVTLILFGPPRRVFVDYINMDLDLSNEKLY
jgi:hypothetical protein